MTQVKEIAKRIWKEPAVFFGFIASLAVLIVTLITGDSWDTSTIIGVIAPLASALGIRSQVTPYVGEHEQVTPSTAKTK